MPSSLFRLVLTAALAAMCSQAIRIHLRRTPTNQCFESIHWKMIPGLMKRGRSRREACRCVSPPIWRTGRLRVGLRGQGTGYTRTAFSGIGHNPEGTLGFSLIDRAKTGGIIGVFFYFFHTQRHSTIAKPQEILDFFGITISASGPTRPLVSSWASMRNRPTLSA